MDLLQSSNNCCYEKNKDNHRPQEQICNLFTLGDDEEEKTEKEMKCVTV